MRKNKAVQLLPDCSLSQIWILINQRGLPIDLEVAYLTEVYGLDENEWKAKWIWNSDKVRVNDFACFRKEIAVKGPVNSALLYVSAHNHFELYINGIKASGYVTPAPAHP